MLVDLGDDVIFQVKIGEQTYDLKEPNESQILALAEDEEEGDTDNTFKKLNTFMVDLGLPKEVVESLGVFRKKKFVSALMGELSKGK